MLKYICFVVVFLGSTTSYSQDSSVMDTYVKFTNLAGNKSWELNEKVNNYSTKSLSKFRKEEKRILGKLKNVDSVALAEYKRRSEHRLLQLEKSLKSKVDPLYNAYLDTLQTALKYLENISQNQKLTQKIQSATESVSNLNNSFSQAKMIEEFFKRQVSELSALTNNSSTLKSLKGLNKTVYYYSERVNKFKAILKDKRKMEQKGLELLSKSKPFRDFMRKNSMLASMFRIPTESPSGEISFSQDLQSRAQINAIIQDRFNTQNIPGESIRAKVAEARNKIKSLQSAQEIQPFKNNHLGFRPNSQRSKPFIKRLEFGTDVQFTKATRYFPRIADVAATIGFKANDYAIVGGGISSKIGFGENWNNISISYEGFSLRGFGTYAAPFALSIYAGYDMHYKSAISNILDMTGINSWQRSGLVGLEKKYRVNRKFKGSFQILWDYLSYNQNPRSQPIVIRTGYTF